MCKITLSLVVFRELQPLPFGYLQKRKFNLSITALQLRTGRIDGRVTYQCCCQSHHGFRNLQSMDSSWNPVFEGIVSFKEVCEHDEHFPALIRSTGVNCILSIMVRRAQGLQS